MPKEADDATALVHKAKKELTSIFVTWLIIFAVTTGAIFGGTKLWRYFVIKQNGQQLCRSANIAISKPNAQLVISSDRLYQLEYAKTDAERQKGLSNRPCIPADAALVFVFEKDGMHGIWMKDMKFSIDIVWLDADKKVVSIEQNVSPETYPKTFYPNKNARYVIEFITGTASLLALDTGTQMNW